MLRMIVVIWVLVTVPVLASAQTPACDGLSGEKKALAQELLSSEHPYDCCDDTIAACLEKKKVCRLAYRLAENICRRVQEGQDKNTIKRALQKRARTILSRSKATIDTAGLPVAGDADSKVFLVEYACARCPYCGKITPKLHEAIVNGALKGKVKFVFKNFPIRSHEFSKETGLGLVAAAKLGKFWEFLLYSYEHFDMFCIKKQQEWAEAVGMDGDKFNALVADPVTRSILVASKKEGIVNKVDATPTFFIDGVMYQGEIDFEELVDVLEEAYERKTKQTYR